MALGAQGQALVAAYGDQVAAVRTRVLAYVQAQWGGLGAYNRADVDRFVSAVLPVVAAGQAQTASLTDGYLAALESIVFGTAVRPIGIPAAEVTVEAIRGVDAREVYHRAGVAVWMGLGKGDALPVAVKGGLQRALSMAATDLQLAKTHTARKVFQRKDNVIGHRRVLKGVSSCGLCIVAATQRYKKDQLSPIHPACVVSGTVVSGPRALKGTSRRYEGEVVVLGTASGNLLTITPNHPVLTRRGWVPAGLLREGDDVVRSLGGHGVVDRVPHEHQVPALIEDRFRALAVAGLVGVPLAAQDFHGDGPDRHVDVVPADGGLWDRLQATLRQPEAHGFLRWGAEPALVLEGGGDLLSLVVGDDAASGGLMGGGSLGLALGWGHPAGSVEAGFLAATDGYPGLDEVSADGGSVHSQGAADRQFRLSGLVAGGDVGGEYVRSAVASTFDAPAVQFSGDGLRVYADRGRSLLDRLAGRVELDRLVQVGRRRLADHVYNLQTTEGWYAAGGLIVSNCDCGISPIYADRDPGLVVDPEQLAGVQERIAERFGAFNSGARKIPGVTTPDGKPVQYRDVLITHEHGELGPILGIRGDRFTGPGDLGD